MPQYREHFYMLTATIHYVRGGQTEGGNEIAPIAKQQTFNLVMQLQKKGVTASALDNARAALFDRLNQESGVASADCRSIVFNSFSYLGFMAPSEFHDIPEPEAAPTEH